MVFVGKENVVFENRANPGTPVLTACAGSVGVTGSGTGSGTAGGSGR